MVNINAQEYINQKYPINGICQRDSDQENKNKTRNEITTLDISKGKVGKNSLFSEEKNLTGSLKLESFTNLQKLIISSHQITSLDVSDCPNLEELYCQDNHITNLNVTNCSNLTKINCSNNNIRELDLSTCTNLNEVDINDCSKLTADKIKSNLTHDKLSGKLVKSSSYQIIQAKENDTRNILIVGMTGGGKSTLANVLTGGAKFEEKSSSTSVTEKFQKSDIFKWQDKNYRLIDNIGFGDSSNISERDILFKIGEGIHSAREGINQILFVVNGRFTPEQIIAFNKFRSFVAESKVAEFITIVKTGFKDFRSQQKCQDDHEKLTNESPELKEIIKSCKERLIYVDNPPIPVVEEGDNEEEKEDKEQGIRINNKKRKESRERILKHLVDNCQEIYKLKS